ncbi:unnamed protein product [Peniophora sp. CBMAI 1063]|nr:unnamed protein product [Peniophora sp. CBMAI 1063]
MPLDRVPHFVHHLRGTGHAAPNIPYFKAISHNPSRTPHSWRKRSLNGGTIGAGAHSAEQGPVEDNDYSAFAQASGVTSTRPGSTDWLIELVVAALRPESDLVTRQYALAALRTLTFGDRKWREINSALLEHCEKGIADVEANLSTRQTEVEITGDDDAATAPAIATSWIGRKLAIQQRPFANGTSNTYFILAPEDYEHGAPPALEDAPLHCLFCIPKRESQDVDDPYRMWILNSAQCWEPIFNKAPHPSLHPYVLKIRAFDKTPSWVLPESVHREERRTQRKGTSATVADPAVIHTPETRSASARRVETSPVNSRKKAVLRFASSESDESKGRPTNNATGGSKNATAGPSKNAAAGPSKNAVASSSKTLL